MIERLAIVGVGLLGGSVAKAARAGELAREIVGIGRDRARLDAARRDGAADRVTTDLEEGVRAADFVLLAAPVLALLDAGIDVHCLRDLTRGGLASALVEIAQAAGLHVGIQESAIPVRDDVHAACELLGFDPLYVANEGRFVAFVPPGDADRALRILETHPVSAGAMPIGIVSDSPAGLVTLKSQIGATRIVDLLTGEQLPRVW